MNIKIVSFFSPNYSSHAGKLIESCKQWGVDHEVSKVKAFRSWHDGVSAKPRFIRHSLDTHSNYDGILWIDADARVMRRLPLDDFQGVDLAVCRFQHSPSHKLEALTGTMFVANNDRVRLLLDDWIKTTKDYKHSDTPEQDALIPLLHQYRNIVQFGKMSVEWVWIDQPTMVEQFPGSIPIIIHSQASRTVRAEEFRREQSQEK